MYGVSEPISYYRNYGNKLFKVPWQNDDQFAQQALFIVLYHWGFHAWGCYILVALLLGFVSFRWDMPMTLRIAFYPLIGDVVHGLFGDVVVSFTHAIVQLFLLTFIPDTGVLASRSSSHVSVSLLSFCLACSLSILACPSH